MDGIRVPSASSLLTLFQQCSIHVVNSTSRQLPTITLMQLFYEMHESCLIGSYWNMKLSCGLFFPTVVFEWKEVYFISCTSLSTKKLIFFFPVKSTLTTIYTVAKCCDTISSEAILSRQTQQSVMQNLSKRQHMSIGVSTASRTTTCVFILIH